MTKTSDLSLAVTELRRCGETLIGVSERLADLFAGGEKVEQPQEEQPVPKPITLEAVRAVLADKSRIGHTANVRTLLEKYGAPKLSQIDPANYAALLAEAEELGNG